MPQKYTVFMETDRHRYISSPQEKKAKADFTILGTQHDDSRKGQQND